LDLSAAAQAKEDARDQRKAMREEKARLKRERIAIFGTDELSGGGSGGGEGGEGDEDGEDEENEEDVEDQFAPRAKHKYVRVAAAMLQDEKDPSNEEDEEDLAVKASRLEKQRRKEARKKSKKSNRAVAGLLPFKEAAESEAH
jgi:hypothetical protein